MLTSPNLSQPLANDERIEGPLDEGMDDQPLSIDLSDEDVLRLIRKTIEQGEIFWNKELEIDKVREKAETYYLGKTLNEEDLYEHQVPYKNNRILTAIEILVPLINSQFAQPIITEAEDTDESRELARDLENVLLAKVEDLYLKARFAMCARHLLIGYRNAILKYRFDPNIGKNAPDGTRKGGIVVEVVRPAKVVFSEGASDPDNIPVVAEYMDDLTREEIIFKFPEKKAELFAHWGIKQGTKAQLAKKEGYIEVYFTYYDSQGEQQEGVAWKLDDILLGKHKNPNYNYDEYQQMPDGKYRALNFFDKPKKPYIIINHTNLGKYVIDDTSLAEQAHTQQDVLEKRGRQIVENADQASAGLVLNSNMISQEDAKKIIGDPSEKIMVAGDVRSAAARLPYNALPNYVLNDKVDARGEIDNIFGANAPVRGENSGIETLGQEVMSQRANMGRLQTITDALEDAADKLYKALVQIMKVYMDEEDIIRFTPSEGKTRFINWSQAKIEDGIQVRVKAGSALPKDKFALKNETIQAIAILDPLSIAEGLDKPNPKEWAKRLVYYRFFMDKYLSEILGDEGSEVDSQAMGDIQALLSGQTPPVPDAPSKEYIATIDKFMSSPGFQQIQDPGIKQAVVEFAKQVMNKAQQGIGEAGQPVTLIEQPPVGEEALVETSTPGGGIISKLRGLFGGRNVPLETSTPGGGIISKLRGLFGGRNVPQSV